MKPDIARGYGLLDFVLRGKEATFDTLAWEAYREGYDDARYLATLKRTLKRAEESGSQPTLVRETRSDRWLPTVTVLPLPKCLTGWTTDDAPCLRVEVDHLTGAVGDVAQVTE